MEFEIKICGTPWKIFQACLSKQHCTCQWNFFEEINVFFKHTKFSSTSSFLEQKFSAFSRSFSGRIVKTAYYVSLGTFWRKTFSCESLFFQQFHTLREEFSAFRPPAKIFFGRCVKIAFFVSNGPVWGICFWKKWCFLYYFRTISKKTLTHCDKEFSSASKKTILCVHRKQIEEKKFLVEKLYFLVIFVPWEKNFRPSVVNVSGGSVKTAFYVSGRIFWGYYCFFFKHCEFSSIFLFIEQKCLAFSWNLSGGAVKTAFYVSNGTVWGKKFL